MACYILFPSLFSYLLFVSWLHGLLLGSDGPGLDVVAFFFPFLLQSPSNFELGR